MSDETLNQNEVAGSAQEDAALPLFDQIDSDGDNATTTATTVDLEGNAQDHAQGADSANPQENDSDEGATSTRRQRAEKSDLSKEVLAKSKAVVKQFEVLLNHDEIDAQIRDEIQQLMIAQKSAMERKLNNEASPEGEDFDSISKRLRRANNKLDSHIESKVDLYAAVMQAIAETKACLENMQLKVKEIEEEVG